MSEDEARRSMQDEEQAEEDVEGHRHTLNQSEEQTDEGEDDDVEAHRHTLN
jgi:beta-galactosidase beta subunit